MPSLTFPSHKKRIQSLPSYREVFTHSTQGEFDITGTRELIQVKLKVFTKLYGRTISLAQIIPYIRDYREIDQTRVMEMVLTEPDSLDDPGIFLLMPNKTHLMIDGHHRAMARSLIGLSDFRAFIIPLHKAVRWTPAARAALESTGGPMIDLPWGEYDVTPTGFVPRKDK